MRVFLLVVVALISSCDSLEHRPIHGHLYFAAGNYIGLFDLSDGSSSAVANLGDVTIDHVSSFTGGDLLLTIRVYVNGRETSRILRFDPRRYGSSPLFPGLTAKFLPGTKSVIYDDGLRLLATGRENAYRDETVIDAHGYNSKPAVVVLSDTEILFNSLNDGDALIQRYDIVSNVSQPLPELSRVCDLGGAIWLAGSGQLLCKTNYDSPQGARNVLASLDGSINKTLSLPENKSFRALAYLPDQGLAILSQLSDSWGGGQPAYAVWAFDEATGESYRIAKDQYLGSSVVYRR